MNIVTPVHSRDVQTVIEKREICCNNLLIDKIYVISSSEAEDSISQYEEFIFQNENTIYPELSYKKVAELLNARGIASGYTGWYLQQFIKMAFSFKCEQEYYLIWDADLVPVNPIDLFDEEQKPYFTTKRENHKPYFDTINMLFDGAVSREIDASFIAEHMLIKTSIMKELIRKIEDNDKIPGKYFYEKIMWAIKDEDITRSGFSEYETYGNYVMKFYPDLYCLRRLRTCRHALMLLGKTFDEQIIHWVSESYDLIAYETKEKKSIISFGLSNKFVREKFTFRQVVHWYVKYIIKVECGIQNAKQSFIDQFWISARCITEKMGIYNLLKGMQRNKKE